MFTKPKQKKERKKKEKDTRVCYVVVVLLLLPLLLLLLSKFTATLRYDTQKIIKEKRKKKREGRGEWVVVYFCKKYLSMAAVMPRTGFPNARRMPSIDDAIELVQQYNRKQGRGSGCSR